MNAKKFSDAMSELDNKYIDEALNYKMCIRDSVTGRVIPKSERERLEIFERMLSGMQAQEAPQIGRTETDFYRN